MDQKIRIVGQNLSTKGASMIKLYNIIRKIAAAFISIAFISMTGVCARAQEKPSREEVRHDYLLGVNDQLKIWVLGVEEITDKPIRVEPDGDIDLPLVGKIHAAGLTTAQLKDLLVERYSKELLKPQISVEMVDYGSQPVSILGAVNRPGVHQLEGRKTLMEVISMGEGLRQDSGTRVTISRQIKNGPIPLLTARTDPTGQYSVADVGVKDLLSGTHPSENILILPNDVVTVLPAESVFVIGEVKKPGPVVVSAEGMTVLRALSTAEGLGPMSSPGKSMIVRVSAGSNTRTEIPVDLKKILAGQTEDFALRANDILLVPSSTPKRATTRALEAAIQAATGVAVFRAF
jgi:polysaccharide biosynthesis/export protein